VRQYKNGTSQRFTYYHCTRKRPCTQRSYLREEDLFQQCVDELDRWELDPELGEWSMAALNRLAHTEVPESKSVAAMQQQAIDEVQAQYDTLLDMSTRRLIDENTFVKKATELKATLKELHKTQSSAAQSTMDWYDYLTDLIIKFTNANETFVTGDMGARKDLLLAIGQNPVVLDGQLKITPNEWLIPLREKTIYFRQQMERVRTLPQQRQKSLLEALRREWLAILDEVRTCLLLSKSPNRFTLGSELSPYAQERTAA